MRICQDHWGKLRDAIKSRGLATLIARNSEDAHANTVAELKGESTEVTYDPLMAAHNMILSHAMQWLGLGLMVVDENGGHKCPICEFCAHVQPPPEGHRYKDNESYMIDGPADAVLAHVQETPVLRALAGL